MVKNPPANAGDLGSIAGSGRSPEEEMTTHSSTLAWQIPGTGRLAGYSPWHLRVGHNGATGHTQMTFKSVFY